ncbi:DUF1566 domain-containing protein [Candidatus Poribacteria bacterium]|nr:DUF1566 domain-containing protein [Candidatus Poribacteria bacterium]
MFKTRKTAVILTLAVAFCFALTWLVLAGPEAGPTDPVTKIWAIFNLRNKNMATSIPIWQITIDKTAQSINWGDQPPNPRFATYDSGIPGDMTDDIVLDKETGLVWEKAPSMNAMDWDSALFESYQYYLGGRKGWRLPTIEELASLVDPNGGPPTLPSGHPFINVQSVPYWSSTTGAGATTDAWCVNFANGDVEDRSKNANQYVWCVRGGQGHDSY